MSGYRKLNVLKSVVAVVDFYKVTREKLGLRIW